jgi:hypothetical protein
MFDRQVKQQKTLAFSITIATAISSLGLQAAEPTVDYARDIRPLLADACFACHGPDEAHREADLRLDQPGHTAIKAGDPGASELIARITSEDPDSVMPPPHVGKPLAPESIKKLRLWIKGGAPYADHWAFTPPQKSPLPKIETGDPAIDRWPRGPIDAFVLDRLLRREMTPSAPASREKLLRRLHLDLTGLPPTPDEVTSFLNDASPTAFETKVSELLQSVHYGERWGRVWLDAARYADSDGFEKDKPRSVWFYRDWVVRALNADMPYDQFLLKQVAGDLLPDATQDDRVATGFMRNSMINEEGGVDPEQFRMEAMFDRMDAIGKSMLGLTIQCAQCHSHKYDPISHTDYYGLFAFINNCDEACITVFTPEEEAARRATLDQVNQIVRDALDKDGDWLSRMIQWESSAMQAKSSDWNAIDIAFIAETIGGQKFLRQDDASYIAAGYAPTKFHPTGDVIVDSLGRITAVKVEMLNDPNLPHSGPGRSVDGTWALSEIELQVPKVDDAGNETWHKVAWQSATATIDLPQLTLGDQYSDKTKNERLLGPVRFAIDGDLNTAWHGDHGPGRRNDPQTAMFVLAEPIAAATVDGKASPIRFRIKLSQNHGGWNSDDNQTHNLGRFRVSVTNDPSPAIKPLPPRVMEAISIPIGQRDERQTLQSILPFIRQDHLLKGVAGAIDKAWENYPTGTSQLVLAQRETPRQTRRLERGDFLSPQELITPAIPALLNHSPSNPTSSPTGDQQTPPSRLDFARWIASPGSPTTARSIVNRIWQEYFGVGLTATSDDLGMQGEPPVHSGLLDFLAVDFVENGWSLKHLHRQIVMSSTYQQDSSLTPQQFDADPQNRLLARGPRVRVPAEMVRDIALSASGLLNPQVGGPPVFPPAPDFLFKPPASYGPKTWSTSDGGDRYRRAIYTFRFRSVPYPVLEAFDAPNGDVSCIRRSASNTPLQALVMLNEPMFLECARELAKHAKSHAEKHDDDEAIRNVFVSCTSRFPTSDELSVLADLLSQQRARFGKELDTAKKLAAIDTDQASELAAWTVVCRVILNLDETITKP